MHDKFTISCIIFLEIRNILVIKWKLTMKTYTQGLVTGILLTASAMMFMGAVTMQAYDD